MTYVRSPRALWRRVGASVVVAAIGEEEVHELAGGASTVWDELVEPRTLPEVVASIARRTGRAEEELRAQVEACVEQMLRIHAVEVAA